jgi:hypothetical protein
VIGTGASYHDTAERIRHSMASTSAVNAAGCTTGMP